MMCCRALGCIFRHSCLVLAVLAVLAGSLAGDVSAGEELTLRLNDAEAEPGGIVAVTIRTYSPRPIGQGQICFRGMAKSVAAPFVGMEDGQVFSSANDAQVQVAWEPDEASQTAMVEFFSPSGTINEADGPMVVFLMRLSPDLEPDEEFLLELDPEQTQVFDAAGNAVPLELRGGELRVREPDDEKRLEVQDGAAAPGQVATLGLRTSQSFAIAAGQLVLTYDASLLSGVPTVTTDARYGDVFYAVDGSTPGKLVISLSSPDLSFNQVPGEIFSVHFPVSPTAEPGSDSKVRLRGKQSYLLGANGEELDLELRRGELEVQ